VIREMTRLGDVCGAINLSQGLPDFDTPEPVLQAALDAIRRGENQYTFPFGSLAFREAVALKGAKYNGIQADPETEVTITCGVSEAIMATTLALTDPGDEVVILEPWYENYVPDCLMAGVTPRYVALQEPGYTLEEGALREAFGPKTRLVFVNTPHNPTGRVLSRAELEIVAKVCREFDVFAVTDEIYDRILFDGLNHISLATLPGMSERTVTISGLGKAYSVTGWRVGWAVGAAPLTGMIRKVHDYLTVCAPAPFQAAGIAALSLPESYYAEMCDEYDARRRILVEGLSAAGFGCGSPEGAYYVMADFADIDWPEQAYARPEWTRDRAFAEYMARQVGVAVVPGSSFYAREGLGTRSVRFNFAKRVETMRAAAARLARMAS
jgi:aminotransferase